MLVHSIKFNVKGVTFDNEDGKDIQKEIVKILNEYKKNDYFDELYNGYTDKEIKEMDLNVSQYKGYLFPAKLVGDEYNGEECLKIYFKTYKDNYIHVGYAPKEKINEIAEWITKKDIKVEGKLEVTGGKYKKCKIETNDDYEEVERIEIVELTYGLEITLNFYDNRITNNNKIRRNETKAEKPVYKKWYFWFLVVLLIMILNKLIM